MKESVSVSGVIDLLNDALKRDPEAISALFRYRVECTPELGEHPTIQVHAVPKNELEPRVGVLKVGILGLLNGMFGLDGNSGVIGAAAAKTDGQDEGTILRFVDVREIRKGVNPLADLPGIGGTNEENAPAGPINQSE